MKMEYKLGRWTGVQLVLQWRYITNSMGSAQNNISDDEEFEVEENIDFEDILEYFDVNEWYTQRTYILLVLMLLLVFF